METNDVERRRNIDIILEDVIPWAEYEVSTESGRWLCTFEQDGENAYVVYYRDFSDPRGGSFPPNRTKSVTKPQLREYLANLLGITNLEIEEKEKGEGYVQKLWRLR